VTSRPRVANVRLLFSPRSHPVRWRPASPSGSVARTLLPSASVSRWSLDPRGRAPTLRQSPPSFGAQPTEPDAWCTERHIRQQLSPPLYGMPLQWQSFPKQRVACASVVCVVQWRSSEGRTSISWTFAGCVSARSCRSFGSTPPPTSNRHGLLTHHSWSSSGGC
jgi:hypothetical protein